LRGELVSVDLPDGSLIEYVSDSLGRRIAKKINGIVVEKYLWQGLIQLLAVYDGSSNLAMRFEYADARMPVAMTKGGATYYLTYDQVGSLRVVVDASGNVVKRIDYDSFGDIINDTNPGSQVPFGFAGGLHDRDIGLVRFGFRDYDPDIGRWTAKDAIIFKGGAIDLYGYVANNPINFTDPTGRASFLYEAILHLAIAFLETLIEPSLHKTEEDEWMADYWAEIERQKTEEMIKESGLREYLEKAEELNQRLNAIISIYENEFQKQPCP
jgi:RHS repeat-associated protein